MTSKQQPMPLHVEIKGYSDAAWFFMSIEVHSDVGQLPEARKTFKKANTSHSRGPENRHFHVIYFVVGLITKSLRRNIPID